MTAPNDLLTTAEVARLLRVHPKHVYRLLRRGLPGRRVGGEWRFVQSEVLAWSRHATGNDEPAPESRPVMATTGSPPPLIAANGDVAIELLLEHLNSDRDRAFGFVQGDRARSIKLLQRGVVLAAGCHGELPPTRLGMQRLARIHLVTRSVGLCARSGSMVPTMRGLSRRSLALRPATAGIMTHFRAAARRERIDPQRLIRDARVFLSHRDVVCAIWRGEAEVGLVTRAWAGRAGLAFRALATEPYGLLVHASLLGHPDVSRLCEVAQSLRFREALAAIEGYDPTGAGDIRYDTDVESSESD